MDLINKILHDEKQEFSFSIVQQKEIIILCSERLMRVVFIFSLWLSTYSDDIVI